MKQRRPSEVSFRAIGLGLILIPINCYWLVISRQPYQYQAIPTIISPFFNVIFILFVIIILNRLWVRFAPNYALTQGELITLYIMLSVTSAIQSFQMMQTLIPIMEHPFTYATPENDWKNLFVHYIPSWLSVSDKRVLRDYYAGESTLYITRYIQKWLVPSLWWSAFVVVLVLVLCYVTVLFRRPWVEHEKLSYPTIQLPLEITTPTTSIFKNRCLWVGVGISGGFALINGLASLNPAVPMIKIHPYHHNLGRYITSKPWNAMGGLPVGIIFPVVGLAFFMPLDMSLSCIVFYLFWKIQRIITVTVGFQRVASTSYVAILNQQAFGALIGIAITLFLWKSGMAIWLSITLFLLYYTVSLGLTRIRAEMGVPLHDFHFTGPDQMLPDILGSRRLGSRNLTVMSMLGFFNFTYRAHPQPHQMEGLALLNRAGVSNKRFVLAMTLALIVGTLTFCGRFCAVVNYRFARRLALRWSYGAQ